MTEEPGNYQEIIDAADVAACFPKIAGKYRRTSDATINYNCLAWAVGANWAWFDPTRRIAGYFWPVGIEREWTTPAIRKLLSHFGFEEEAENSDPEDGYVKVAVYLDNDGTPTHFARQLENGKWTSKLGELIDVDHETLDCLECDAYGAAGFFLKKRRFNPPERG